MRIEFDPAKDEADRQKHGISLEAANDMDFDRAAIIEDRRRDYGEVRYIAYAPLKGRLHVLWFTRREDAIRAIGSRKANERERSRYERTS